MKNRNNEERYLVIHDSGNKHDLVVIARSSGGVAYAFHGFSDTVLGRAGGYGYDKESQALSLAVEKLTGKEIGGYGAGVRTVISNAKAQGVTVLDWYAMVECSIDAYKRSKSSKIHGKRK